MKAYWGSEGIVQHILNLYTKWTWVVNCTPQPLFPQRKGPWYPLYRRMGGPQIRSGHNCSEEKNSQPLPRLEAPIIQPVAQRYTAELSWLQHVTYAVVEGSFDAT
jgi:hypothetical protein